MSSSDLSSMPEPRTLLTGLSLGESPRWHDGRLWLSDWGTQEVLAVDLEGTSEVIVRPPTFPFCIDRLPDGRLLIVSGGDGLLLRREPDGSLVTHADLSRLSGSAWNDIVVDGRGQRLRQRHRVRLPRRRVRSRDRGTGHARWLRPPGGR